MDSDKRMTLGSVLGKIFGRKKQKLTSEEISAGYHYDSNRMTSKFGVPMTARSKISSPTIGAQYEPDQTESSPAIGAMHERKKNNEVGNNPMDVVSILVASDLAFGAEHSREDTSSHSHSDHSSSHSPSYDSGGYNSGSSSSDSGGWVVVISMLLSAKLSSGRLTSIHAGTKLCLLVHLNGVT